MVLDRTISHPADLVPPQPSLVVVPEEVDDDVDLVDLEILYIFIWQVEV